MRKKQRIKDFFSFYLPLVGQFVLITLEMQLFLSCIYIPILTYWGLSWPILSIVSTPVFMPLCVLFLILSALVFLNALVSSTVIPIFIIGLECVRVVWLFILKTSPLDYQFGFCLPPVIFLFSLPCFALYTVSLSCGRGYKIFYLSASIVLFYGLTCVIALHKPSSQVLETDRGSFHFVLCNGKRIVVDSGGWKKAVPYPSWFFYTLMPTITKASGVTLIDIWIITSFKKNFSRFVDSVSLLTPTAQIVTHEKNFMQLTTLDRKNNVMVYYSDVPFMLDQFSVVIHKKSIVISCKEKIFFKTLIH